MMTDKPTILLIDDNVSLVLGFARVLQNAGYIVHTAYTAAEGLRLAALHRPDAIVLDFQMPLINGAGFLYRLRELATLRHTPVMILTGMVINDEQRDEFAALRAIVRFKPIGPREFLAETARMVTRPMAAPAWAPAGVAERQDATPSD